MKHLLAHLVSGKPMSVEQTLEAFESMMTGQATPAQIASVLSIIAVRGATEDELVGAARVMRAKATPVVVPVGLTPIDTCGTGGDHAETFNISTAAALVAAAAGRPRKIVVAKHGNRAVTSKSGSSQVLEALGVKLKVSDTTLTKCLDEAGICFCFAPMHHPAMKHALPVRQELGFRTIFNLLGPLTNPAGARRQVVGVYAPELTEPIANVLRQLGSVNAIVVSGRFGEARIDELTTTGVNRISHLRGGRVTTNEVEPTMVGLKLAEPDWFRVDSPQASALVIKGILAGKPSPARDIVCLNAAAALLVAELVNDLTEGIRRAAMAIDNGSAKAALEKLVAITTADTTV